VNFADFAEGRDLSGICFVLKVVKPFDDRRFETRFARITGGDNSFHFHLALRTFGHESSDKFLLFLREDA
jgi:hypothetical protein